MTPGGGRRARGEAMTARVEKIRKLLAAARAGRGDDWVNDISQIVNDVETLLAEVDRLRVIEAAALNWRDAPGGTLDEANAFEVLVDALDACGTETAEDVAALEGEAGR